MSGHLSHGVVHKVPVDLRAALSDDHNAITSWQSLTPLARNEWICWILSVKKPETRQKHIKRTVTELLEGKRRPCCWIGCIHRKDKPMSASQKWVLGKRN